MKAAICHNETSSQSQPQVKLNVQESIFENDVKPFQVDEQYSGILFANVNHDAGHPNCICSWQ